MEKQEKCYGNEKMKIISGYCLRPWARPLWKTNLKTNNNATGQSWQANDHASLSSFKYGSKRKVQGILQLNISLHRFVSTVRHEERSEKFIKRRFPIAFPSTNEGL